MIQFNPFHTFIIAYSITDFRRICSEAAGLTCLPVYMNTVRELLNKFLCNLIMNGFAVMCRNMSCACGLDVRLANPGRKIYVCYEISTA
jgi:hypothetical protein